MCIRDRSIAGEDDSKDPNVSGSSLLDTSLGYDSADEEDAPPPNQPMTAEEEDATVLNFAHDFAMRQWADNAPMIDRTVQYILGLWRQDNAFTPRALALFNQMNQAPNQAALIPWINMFFVLLELIVTPQLDALFEAWLAEVEIMEHRRLHLRNPVPENFTSFEFEPESPERSPRNFGGGSPTR